MTELLSVFAKHNVLYLAEIVDNDIKVRAITYDKPINAAHNMPSSSDERLPTDQVLLDQYSVGAFAGQYYFEYHNGEPNGYLTYIRNVELNKDIFMCHNTIVHVQDFEPTSTDNVVNELIDCIKYSDNDPLSFIKLADERLGKLGIDIEKEVESMVFEEPKKSEEPEEN